MSNDTVDVCPECGDSSILHSAQSNHGGTHGTEKYRCTTNGHAFEEPDERETLPDVLDVPGVVGP